MVQVNNEILEKVSKSKLVGTQELVFFDMEDIFGDKNQHKLTFDLYDGFGFCKDYQGRTYYLTYPRLEITKTCKTIAEKIREFLGYDDKQEITITDIVVSYSTLNVL